MELTNGEKSIRGKNAQNNLEELVARFFKKGYLPKFTKEYRLGKTGFKNNKQFYSAFHLEITDSEEWILFTTTSLRTDRIKGNQWDAFNLKEINPKIKKAFLIYPDGLSKKENEKFNKQQKKYKNNTNYSCIDDILSYEEFYILLEKTLLRDFRSPGKVKDIQGKNFENRVAEILSNNDNLKRWNGISNIIDGYHYPIFATVLNSFNIKENIKYIYATTDPKNIKKLPSRGNPKTDVLVKITTDNNDTIIKTLSCKRTSSKNVSVHEYSAESFSDVLDKKNHKLKELLLKFQEAGSLKRFGEYNIEKLTTTILPYNDKLSKWVLGGIGGAGDPTSQWASHILTYNNNNSIITCEDIESYIEKLKNNNIQGHFGTLFSWTYPSKNHGKKIQLKCKIIQ